MRIFRPGASLLVLVLAACFAPEGSSPMTGTTTAPAGTTTVADPTVEATTVPGTSTGPTTSPTATSAAPTTTTTGDDSGPTTSTTPGTTSTSTTTDTTTTTSTTTGDDSTAATTLVEPKCMGPSDCPTNGSECLLPACIDGECAFKPAPTGTYCNGFQDQCDALGQCVDCVDNGGCGECCVCAGGICIPG